MIHLDYIIVGQGIAGTMLSFLLLQKEKKVLIIDLFDPNTSSNVAAGILNPITGRKCSLTWKAGDLFPFAKKTYRQMEKNFGEEFFYPADILKIFADNKMQNDWMARSADRDVAGYLSEWKNDETYSSQMNVPYGGIIIKHGGWVDLKVLLSVYRHELRHMGILLEEQFNINQLYLTNKEVKYKEWSASKIIFCDGYRAHNNPYFNWLPFALTKGELLTIKCPGLSQKRIINQQYFLLPIGHHKFKVGATYNWKKLDVTPSTEAKSTILNKLKKLLKVDFSIIDHQAGIRPTVEDRKPLIGVHPDHKSLAIFNGMGSKGTTLVPYFAQHFINHLEQKTPLDPEVDIMRAKSAIFET